jgi:hypothetical protein
MKTDGGVYFVGVVHRALTVCPEEVEEAVVGAVADGSGGTPGDEVL